MKKLTIVAFILFISFLLFQGCAKKMMDSATFQVSPSPSMPSSVGASHKEVVITHGKRTIRTWFVENNRKNNAKKAVVLFNGIGGNLTGWIHFQKFLADSGIVSVSFDYGPLEDTSKNKGSSRLSDVKKDVAAIIDSLKSYYGEDVSIFLLGHSVGNAVMLEMYSDISNKNIRGVIICNAFSSMKNWGIEHGKLPRIFAFAFPDYYNNVSNVQHVKEPVLVMHSKADKINSYKGGSEVFDAVKSDKKFIHFEDFKHNDIFKQGNLAYWEPILNFIITKSK